jgi:putative hydrolase of the HAD superfamily
MDGSADGVRGVILDYGAVLCHTPTPEKVARIAGMLRLDPDTLAIRYEAGRGQYDRGDSTPAEYWSAVAQGAAALEDGLLDRLRQYDVEMWSGLHRDMIEWVARVRAAGFKTALLSNMHVDMAAYVRRPAGWLKHFDAVVLSCEVRLIKPERAIYERCLEGLALPPREALFIDDREVNVAGARSVGLDALRFESIEGLRKDLTERGFPVLPPAE